ncbi:MAG TPA: hypothetical protein VEA99_15025, partial [Gemmatimonadaceae bacterium]|nr:hypothetical protein [Gemmatimonadaceae bacterium]
LWVNVTSAGYRGNYKPAYGKGRVQAPGRALIAISRNGTIERAEFRHLPETGRATPDLPPKVTTPVVPRTVGAGGR